MDFKDKTCCVKDKHRPIHPIVCVGCGTRFMSKKRTSKYCTKLCFHQNMEITEAKREAGRRVSKIGLKYAKRPWDGKTRPDFIGKKHPRWKKPHSETARRLLSDASKRAWERGSYDHMTPEKWAMLHWGTNTKAGSTLRRRIRASVKTRLWRKNVLDRDEHSCRECGNSSTQLDVHHITPFVEICIKRNIASLAEAFQCKELWDVSNGLTLCLHCHNKTKWTSRTKLAV